MINSMKVAYAYLTSSSIYYHATASGVLFDSKYGIHIGTLKAATQAMEARIGIPAEGTWDGTREYGKTLLAGRKAIESGKYGQYRLSGFNVDAPEENYYPQDSKAKASFSDGTPVSPAMKPNILKVKIVGKMTNTPETPLSDVKANATIKAILKRGEGKSGYYYKNDGEDYGSISAVVPNKSFLQVI